MKSASHNFAAGKNRLLDVIPSPMSALIRRASHYCSSVTTTSMAAVLNRLPALISEYDIVSALLPLSSLKSLTLNHHNSTSEIVVHNVQMRTFVMIWGMPTFYRFNIYNNQSNEKLVPQC